MEPLNGIHHISCITKNAQTNVDFYVGILGLKMVKKTVNQDDPTVYHLFYADDQGSPGADLTFFEYPQATKGRAGAGSAYRIIWRVGDNSLDFWHKRFQAHDVDHQVQDNAVLFWDHEGLEHELRVDTTQEEPLLADHPNIPKQYALRGFGGVRTYSQDPPDTEYILKNILGFEPAGENEWICQGDTRSSSYYIDEAPEDISSMGYGSIHHVAFSSSGSGHSLWQPHLLKSHLNPTPVVDRFYFKSIYFREPGGILFEIATQGPGFTADESLDELGQNLSLPPRFAPLKERIEAHLTPIRLPG